MSSNLRTLAKRATIAGGLAAARLIAATGAMRSARGCGAIFTLHHVRPFIEQAFAPNAHLEITPEFLDVALAALTRAGYRFLALDALAAHLACGDPTPVAVFTLDDGYRNNLEHAAPVFARHGAPYTVFVTGGFADRTQTLWWETLGALLDRQTRIRFDFGQGLQDLDIATPAGKTAAFGRIAAFILGPDEERAIRQLDAVAQAHGLSAGEIVERLTLDDAGLQALAAQPLASLGAHTISHRALSRLDDRTALDEMRLSADVVERLTGQRPTSFAYPYGDAASVSARDIGLARKAGFTTAVTTQPGVVAGSSDLFRLPRISLNGHFQKAAYVTALASGIPFRLMGKG